MNNKKLIGIIAGFVVVFILGCVIFYNVGISSVSSKDEDVIVTVEQGLTSSSILDTLDEAGLVKNKLCGEIFLKLNRYDHLQANTYILNKNMYIFINKKYQLFSMSIYYLVKSFIISF